MRNHIRCAGLNGAAAAFLLAAVCAGSVQAQDARLTRRLDAATTAAVSQLVDSARTAGLPVEPLVQKALEGDAVGAAPDRIVHAVRSLLGRLAVARTGLGADATSAELTVGAAAVDVGADVASLHRLATQRGRPNASGSDGDMTHALIGLTYLLQRGVPAQSSLDIVLAMLDARLGASDFTSLQRLVDQDVRAGASPVEAARVRSSALIRGLGGREPGAR
jgi:hypothetical protein